jgi:chemotaxis protein MotB
MRKKKHAEEHENLERWLVSYADFITLLFAFFTVMYALSVSDKAKYRATLENIQRSFLSAGGIFPLRGTPMIPFEKAPDQGAESPPSPTDIGKLPRNGVAPEEKLTAQVRALFKETTGLGLAKGQVEVVRTDDGYKIRLGEQLLFNPGSDKLKRQYIPFLYEMGKRLGRMTFPVQISGHSDSTPFTTKSTNWQLSISRAYNVVQFLVQGTGFPPNRISLAGYGDTQPIADNSTEEGRSRNRRVEISLLAPNHDVPESFW